MKMLLIPRAQAEHILIVMHDFSTGGSERIAIRLANQWIKDGRRVTILCGVGHGPARALLHPHVAVVAMWPPVPRAMLSRFTLARAFAESVKGLRPDLIFSPGNFHISVLGIMARLLGPECPVTITKLSNPLRRPGRANPGMFESMFRWFAGPIDGFVAMSQSLRDEARSVLRRSDIETIYEPNLDCLPKPRVQISQREHRPQTIVCAGRLVSQKAFDLAIRAFALVDRDRRVRLKILGEGPERIKLETLVDQLGLNDRVTFTGYLPDIRPALASADLFLLSSRYEGFPAVLIEALAAGLPCVTTDCSPAMHEIIPSPQFGDIVPATPKALAEAIERRLDDPALVDASELLGRHRIDVVARQYLSYFDRTVAARQKLAMING